MRSALDIPSSPPFCSCLHVGIHACTSSAIWNVAGRVTDPFTQWAVERLGRDLHAGSELRDACRSTSPSACSSARGSSGGREGVPARRLLQDDSKEANANAAAATSQRTHRGKGSGVVLGDQAPGPRAAFCHRTPTSACSPPWSCSSQTTRSSFRDGTLPRRAYARHAAPAPQSPPETDPRPAYAQRAEMIPEQRTFRALTERRRQ